MSTLFGRLLSWRTLLILAVLAALTRIVSLVIVDSGPAATLSMSADEDAYVGYCQLASSTASGLLNIQSPDHFLSTDPTIRSKDLTPPQNLADTIDQSIVHLILLREDALALPSEVRERFSVQHAELVSQTKAACESLLKQEEKNRKIFGDRWGNYRPAFQYDSVLGKRGR